MRLDCRQTETPTFIGARTHCQDWVRVSIYSSRLQCKYRHMIQYEESYHGRRMSLVLHHHRCQLELRLVLVPVLVLFDCCCWTISRSVSQFGSPCPPPLWRILIGEPACRSSRNGEGTPSPSRTLSSHPQQPLAAALLGVSVVIIIAGRVAGWSELVHKKAILPYHHTSFCCKAQAESPRPRKGAPLPFLCATRSGLHKKPLRVCRTTF